ncbi:hypothetical protein BSKO_08629 [Bryopsis sp. KO-2023]|nr:hypothetical protein BSKO_08629 [Bryopsis sp. KO-2023]
MPRTGGSSAQATGANQQNKERAVTGANAERMEHGGPAGLVAGANRETLWGYSLSFHDPVLEGRYRCEAIQSRLQQEGTLHFIGFWGGLMLNFIHWDSLSWVGRAWIFSNFAALPAITSYIAWYKKEMYVRLRSILIFMVTIHDLLLSFLMLESPVGGAWYYILGCIWVKSPTSLAFMMSTNWSLFFKNQGLVLVMTLPALFIWASMFCTACKSSEVDYAEGFGALGSVLSYIPVFITLIPPPGGVPGCPEVTLAIILIMGLLLPMLVVYLLEVQRREAFAKSCLPSRLAMVVGENASDSCYIGVMYFVVAVEVVMLLSFRMGPFPRF